MIELRHVTKRYGAVEALHDVSFRAPEGQIVGLLGQNGAGKSTTLNILTGYLPPTSGQVLVDGMDLLQNARECKRLIGYLPEKPPLYDEMTVRSYLRFVCELKEVQKSAIAAHVEDIIRTCGLSEVAHRLIGHLSKGYRQRVGVAQSLCGNPKVLVLDEPTVGLDPRQVVEIRALIAELGKTHTVIFSSHLLSEIQQLCQRVLILNRGHLEYEADMQELAETGERRCRRGRLRSARYCWNATHPPCRMRRRSYSACSAGWMPRFGCWWRNTIRWKRCSSARRMKGQRILLRILSNKCRGFRSCGSDKGALRSPP